jgi:large subunit ribosomal protein L24
MQRIKVGDKVQVIAGNDVNIRGEVNKVVLGWEVNRGHQRVRRDPNKDRVVVSKINIIKKHQKQTRTRTQTGIIEMEAPIHISNVMIVCSSCDEPVRIGVKDDNGKRYRYCKRCDEPLDSPV